MKNDGIFDLSVGPPFLKFEQNELIQPKTNLTPVDVNHQHLSPEMMHSSDCASQCISLNQNTWLLLICLPYPVWK